MDEGVSHESRRAQGPRSMRVGMYGVGQCSRCPRAGGAGILAELRRDRPCGRRRRRIQTSSGGRRSVHHVPVPETEPAHRLRRGVAGGAALAADRGDPRRVRRREAAHARGFVSVREIARRRRRLRARRGVARRGGRAKFCSVRSIVQAASGTSRPTPNPRRRDCFRTARRTKSSRASRSEDRTWGFLIDRNIYCLKATSLCASTRASAGMLQCRPMA